jgi:hypothetical protein
VFNVDCKGYEDSLLDCTHNTEDDCGEDEAAGVICGAEDIGDESTVTTLTPEGQLNTTSFTRNANSTKSKNQGEFCVTRDYSVASRYQEQIPAEYDLVALYCDPCKEEVLCSYVKQLFDAFTYRRETIIQRFPEDFVAKGFAVVADYNNDGEVDFEEFLEKMKEYLGLIFNILDKDDDNSIYEEAKSGKILQKFSLEFFEKTIVEAMAFFDTNEDIAIAEDDAAFYGGRRYVDRNEDGVVTLSELIGMPVISLPSPLYSLYAKVDKNKDEKLTQEEALDSLKRTFSIIDSNSDCFIDEDEVVGLLEMLNVPENIQLAVRLVLKQYLTLGSSLVKQFTEKADVNDDGEVTMEEVVNFNDFNFIAEKIPAFVDFGHPSGAFYHLIGSGRRRSRQRSEEIAAIWLRGLQGLMENPVYYSESGPTIQCPGLNQ